MRSKIVFERETHTFFIRGRHNGKTYVWLCWKLTLIPNNESVTDLFHYQLPFLSAELLILTLIHFTLYFQVVTLPDNWTILNTNEDFRSVELSSGTQEFSDVKSKMTSEWKQIPGFHHLSPPGKIKRVNFTRNLYWCKEPIKNSLQRLFYPHIMYLMLNCVCI